MKVLIDYRNTLIEFEMTPKGFLGVASIWYDPKQPTMVQPDIIDVKKWIEDGEILEIKYSNEREEKDVLLNILRFPRLFLEVQNKSKEKIKKVV